MTLTKLKPHFEKIEKKLWAARGAGLSEWGMRIDGRSGSTFRIDVYVFGVGVGWETVAKGFRTYDAARVRAEKIGV